MALLDKNQPFPYTSLLKFTKVALVVFTLNNGTIKIEQVLKEIR